MLSYTESNATVTDVGSHKEGQPRRRFVRDENGKLDFDKASDNFDLSEFVPLECKVPSVCKLLQLSSTACPLK